MVTCFGVVPLGLSHLGYPTGLSHWVVSWQFVVVEPTITWSAGPFVRRRPLFATGAPSCHTQKPNLGRTYGGDSPNAPLRHDSGRRGVRPPPGCLGVTFPAPQPPRPVPSRQCPPHPSRNPMRIPRPAPHATGSVPQPDAYPPTSREPLRIPARHQPARPVLSCPPPGPSAPCRKFHDMGAGRLTLHVSLCGGAPHKWDISRMKWAFRHTNMCSVNWGGAGAGGRRGVRAPRGCLTRRRRGRCRNRSPNPRRSRRRLRLKRSRRWGRSGRHGCRSRCPRDRSP